MGDYRITIEAVGGHGCDRKAKVGEPLAPCGRLRCPDCSAREFVEQLTRRGENVKVAILTHWPVDLGGSEANEVKDDLLAGKRIKGDFNH